MKRFLIITLFAICIPAAFMAAHAETPTADEHGKFFTSETTESTQSEFSEKSLKLMSADSESEFTSADLSDSDWEIEDLDTAEENSKLPEETFYQNTQAQKAFGGKPRTGRKLKSIGEFNPSFYWVAVEKRTAEPKNVKLFDSKGRLMTSVSESFYKELRMEGTGILTNGKLINFDSRLRLPDGSVEVRWRWCGPEAPFGYGHGNTPLKEFRSAAVDPKVVPLGSKLYIPAAKGIKLPNGKVHDGIFWAHDVGSMIVERKIDIFTSFGDQSAVFQKNGMPHGKMVKVYIVK